MQDQYQVEIIARNLRMEASRAETIGDLQVVTERALSLAELLVKLYEEQFSMVLSALGRAQTVIAGRHDGGHA